MAGSEPSAKRRKATPVAGHKPITRASLAGAQQDDSTLPTYTYRSLKKEDEIRIFKLEKIGPSEWQYDIEHTTLADASPFETVSYVWGPDTRQNIVRLRHGRTIRINDNLAKALPYLSAECRTGYLWIDQINIDQSSTQERNHQVKMMGDIYKKGERVIAWLGEGKEPSKRLLALIEAASSSLELRETLALTKARIMSHLAKLHLNEFVFILQLLESAWFSRAWVFQEVVLSKQATFLFGDTKIPFLALVWIARQSANYEVQDNECTVSTKDSIRPISCFDTISTRGYHTLSAMHRSWTIASRNLGERHLSFVWQLSRISSILETTDLRDSVYAFLGLQSLEQGAVPIQADYGSTHAETLINTAMLIICNMRSLEILSHCERERDPHLSKRLPSWVPQWRTPLSAALLGPNQLYHERSNFLGQHVSIQTENLEELHVRGVCLDTIDTCFAPEFRFQATTWYDENLGEYLALDERRELVRAHTACSRERLLRVLLDRSCWPAGEPAVDMLGVLSHASTGTLLAAYDTHILQKRVNPQVVTENPILRQLRYYTYPLNTRQLYLTKGGHLGYVRQPCKGDVICALRGFPDLITLRPHGNNRFTVVGACSVEAMLWKTSSSFEYLELYLGSLWDGQEGEEFILI